MVLSTARPEIKFDPRIQAVIEAVENFDMTNSSSWSDLDALSTHTIVDGLYVEPEGIIIEDEGNFRGVVNVYILLEYGNIKDDGFQETGSFLGKFRGHFNGKVPTIDDLTVDTSLFYAGEAGLEQS